MFFSVIVPVYKVEKYLRACVESVLNQTFGDFELILVDDGSPDECPRICDEYKEKDKRVRVVHKANGGLASARRAGIKVAEGDYVYNLDSDDEIELDTLECAYKIINEYKCDIVSFGYKWVENGTVTGITDDGIEEGFYSADEIKKCIFPRLLMDENMNHISYYLSGKAVLRELLTPNQLNVSEKISLGEDLCCVLPCYSSANGVYISKKAAYLYTVNNNSISKKFNANQIYRIEDVINFITCLDVKMPENFDEQVSRYSCFMCFAILAAAAENNHFESIKEIENNILNSVHIKKIKEAKFGKVSVKSRIGIFLMKRKCIKTTFYFLNFCKKIKRILKKG